MAIALTQSQLNVLNLNCFVPVLLVFTVVYYGHLTQVASKIFALRRENLYV